MATLTTDYEIIIAYWESEIEWLEPQVGAAAIEASKAQRHYLVKRDLYGFENSEANFDAFRHAGTISVEAANRRKALEGALSKAKRGLSVAKYKEKQEKGSKK